MAFVLSEALIAKRIFLRGKAQVVSIDESAGLPDAYT